MQFNFSFAVGERPLPSVQPGNKQKFSKQRRIDRRGGGLVLECNYILVPYPSVNQGNIVAKIQNILSQMDGNESSDPATILST